MLQSLAKQTKNQATSTHRTRGSTTAEGKMYENNKLGEEAEVIRIDNDMVDEGKRVSC